MSLYKNMIISCKSCLREFIVKDKDIPAEGRTVKCGFCSITWHQMPIYKETKTTAVKKVNKIPDENPSAESVKASDGKTYKFLGSQWAILLPSGKTGLFAKKKISQELNRLTGRKVKNIVSKKKIKKELNPSFDGLGNAKQLPDIYNPKEGLGFLGYIFLLIIVSASTIGIIKTFEDDWLNYFPQDQYIFDLLDEQLEYIVETLKNIFTIVEDLIKSY
jgi:predicted Zn finger-like uncharacterized protein